MRNNTRWIVLAALAAAIAPLLGPPAAWAQGNGDSGRVREALQRTDEIIASAKGIVDESRSQKGRVSLEMAVGIQLKAWDNYRGSRLAMAGKLTMEARDEAWHAIALARNDAQGEESFGRLSDQTIDRIARLREMIAESGIRDEQSVRLLEEARTLLEKSRSNAQQYRYQLAVKLAEDARQLTVRAEERIRNQRTLKEMAERRLAVLERLIERARDRVREVADERSRADLANAERHLEKAKSLIDEGRYREAGRALDTCEKMLRSSVRLVSNVPAGDPAAQIEEARRLLERTESMLAEDGRANDPKAVAALARARELLARAEDALAAGKADQARALANQVRETLREAARAEGGLTKAQVAERLARIEALREETRNLVSSCPVPGVRDLMERAEEHLMLAHEHERASRLDSADAEASIARNIYQRISELCAR